MKKIRLTQTNNTPDCREGDITGINFKKLLKIIGDPSMVDFDLPKAKIRWSFKDDKNRESFVWCYLCLDNFPNCYKCLKTDWGCAGNKDLLKELFNENYNPYETEEEIINNRRREILGDILQNEVDDSFFDL